MDHVNFALIGCGKIAERHIEAIRCNPQAQLVAVCDADKNRATDKAQLAKVPFYENYHAMLQAHPEINVVNLLTPTGLHYQQGKDIIKNYAKHLLIEKPLVLTLDHAMELKQIADAHRTHIFPIYQNRFNKAVQRVKQALNQQELGRLRVGTIRVRWCRPQRYYDLSAWRGTWQMDGGALTNQGIHFIDLLRYLCGEVKRVHAKLGTFGAAIEVEDTGVAILEFENGALGILEIMTSARPHDFEAALSCVCEKGLAELSGIASNELRVFTPDPSQTTLVSEKFENGYGFGHNLIMHGVVETLIAEKKPAIEFEDGVETLRLLHALYQSDEVGQWVNVKEGTGSKRLGLSSQCVSAPVCAL